MADLSNRGLRKASELASDRPHGDRLKYVGGCRCDPCRAANAAYERDRIEARKNGDWNGFVPADRARQHMLELAEKGVGRRAVGAASDVADSILMAIRSGEKKQIRARTEKKILAVTEEAISDRALIAAKPTWKKIHKMIVWGYSKAEIAKRLGYTNPALQLDQNRVTARNAHDVDKLFAEISREVKQRDDADRVANKLAVKCSPKNDGSPLIVRKKGTVNLKQPDSIYAVWGGYR